MMIIKKLTGQEFIWEYRDTVRPITDWDVIKGLKPELKVINKDSELGKLYLCWSVEGSNKFFGKKHQVKNISKSYQDDLTFDYDDDFYLFRLPAVEYKGKLMLIDGNHRACWLYYKTDKPFVLLLDYVSSDEPIVFDNIFLK